MATLPGDRASFAAGAAACPCGGTAAGGLRQADPDKWLEGGLTSLRVSRTGDGRWQSYPFHYTLLTLTETDLPGAREELRYAAPACERAIRLAATDDVYVKRRRAVAERALARL